VLSRGLLSRAHLPRFTGENISRNEELINRLSRLAAERGLKAAQLAIAWVLAKGRRIIPVIGARTRAQLSESLGALRVKLTEADLPHRREHSRVRYRRHTL
jgi:aryl-alcohol dehydrogenase-like predicted oxidoreductase